MPCQGNGVAISQTLLLLSNDDSAQENTLQQ
jgi:hypothetical protein